jgi:hypothetical protein
MWLQTVVKVVSDKSQAGRQELLKIDSDKKSKDVGLGFFLFAHNF